MKKSEYMVDAIGFLDEDLLQEAEEARFSGAPKENRRVYSRPMRIAALTASAAVLIFGAFLFPRFFLRMGNQAGTQSQEAVLTQAPAAAEQKSETENGGALLTQGARTQETAGEAAEVIDGYSAEEAGPDEAAAEEAVPADAAAAGEVQENSVSASAPALDFWPGEETVSFEGKVYRPALPEEAEAAWKAWETFPDEPSGTVSGTGSELDGADVFASEDNPDAILINLEGKLYIFFLKQ